VAPSVSRARVVAGRPHLLPPDRGGE
ncbi:MAG: hypothetical protein AVDCRST_MAG89-860, partial [uncultured Gemmatimonadetes bacterium]